MNIFCTVNKVAPVSRNLSTTGVPHHIGKEEINEKRSKNERDEKINIMGG